MAEPDGAEGDDQAFARMVEACIEAGQLVEAAGSPDLKRAMRAALVVLGCDVARRLVAQDEAPDEL